MRPTKVHTNLFSATLAFGLSLCICGWTKQTLAQDLTPPDRGVPEGREGGGTRATESPAPGTANRIQEVGSLKFEAPDRGRPEGRREGAGTRGSCALGQKPLTALIPPTNSGQTLSGHPTFFFYVPQTRSLLAEFAVLDEKNQPIYQTNLNVTGIEGVVSVSLPETSEKPLLEAGKGYKWQFAILCNPDTQEDDLIVDGWIERVQPDATLVQQIEKASGRDRVVLLARSGFWYDTLHSLAELRTSEPNNTAFADDWTNLLQSVGLEKVSSEPLVKEPEKE